LVTQTPRTPRTPLSRDRLLAAAVEIADADGIQAVTMRRLAGDLGVEAMSLYHHLPGKEALLDGIVDTVVGEIGVALGRLEAVDDPAAGDWRAAVRRRCLTAREVMQRHPWAPALMGARPAIPPAVYLHFEAILATLIGAGFSYHLAHRALHALGSMALGFVAEPFSPAAAPGEPDADPSAEELAMMAETLPHLAAMVAAESHAGDDTAETLGWCDSRAEFEFTLDLLLDGLARHLG
jgi:AcrR family transcriptional regulator